jgi:transposase
MARRTKYSREVRECAVTLVMECQQEYDSQWGDPLDRGEGERVDRDAAQVSAPGGDGCRAAAGRVERGIGRVERLRREYAELRRANEILKAASAFFARELCATRRRVDRARRKPTEYVRGDGREGRRPAD